jgi:MATE family multidrug resistance protein
MGRFAWGRWRVELRRTVRLAGPVAAAQLAQISMGFVDTLMVGRLGQEALAGVALGNTLFFFLFLVCTGVVQAVGPMVSQAHGAGTREPVERSVRQGLWLGLFLAVPAGLICWNAEPLLRLLGQTDPAVTQATGYLRAILWGLPAILWFMALRSFVEGLARPLPVTIITALGVGLNVMANYGLMFGAWGLPALGLVGTGWASTVVYWSLFAMLGLFVARVAPFRDYRIFRHLRVPDPTYLRELLRIGGPMGASSGIESGLFMITTLMMGWIGTTALAAHQIALQCAAFTFMVPLGIGIAGSVRVGQAAGRGAAADARRAGLAAIAVATTFMVGAAVLFWSAPGWIVGLYLDAQDPGSTAVAQMATSLLAIAAVFQVFDGVQVAAMGALRGLKDTRVPMLIALATYWGIGLSAGYGLGFVAGWGGPGLWWGLVLGLLAAAVLLTRRFGRHVERIAVSTRVAPDSDRAPSSRLPS